MIELIFIGALVVCVAGAWKYGYTPAKLWDAGRDQILSWWAKWRASRK